MTGTFSVSFDRSGFGIVVLTLTDANGRELAVLDFAPGDATTYLQPGSDLHPETEPAQVLAALAALADE